MKTKVKEDPQFEALFQILKAHTIPSPYTGPYCRFRVEDLRKGLEEVKLTLIEQLVGNGYITNLPASLLRGIR